MSAATRLLQVVTFTNVAPATPTDLPHNINVDGVAKTPDFVATDVPGFTVAVTSSTVAVTNTTGVAATVNVWLELKHSIPRQLGGGVDNLIPQPFVAAAGGSSGGSGLIQTLVADVTADVETAGDSPGVTLLSQAITVAGGNSLIVNFSASGQNNAGGGTVTTFRLLLDGNLVKGASFTKMAGSVIAASCVAIVARIPALTAGSHTVSVEWQAPSNTTSINAASDPDGNHATLLLQEVSV